MNSYYVYIITNKYNTVLYAGVTNNLERRMVEHKNKLIEGYSKKYNLTKLVFYEEFKRIEDAVAGEKKIKGWKRNKKNALINSINPKWEDLSSV